MSMLMCPGARSQNGFFCKCTRQQKASKYLQAPNWIRSSGAPIFPCETWVRMIGDPTSPGSKVDQTGSCSNIFVFKIEPTWKSSLSPGSRLNHNDLRLDILLILKSYAIRFLSGVYLSHMFGPSSNSSFLDTVDITKHVGIPKWKWGIPKRK